jgi:signal-transduction protein with cAMP-binding, CBS, and nucleotidyltransferase domain
MKVEEIMIREVVQSSPENSITEAAKLMREKAVGCLVITADGAIKGLITDRDLLGCIAAGHNPRECKISAHMSRPVAVIKPEEERLTAADVMRRRRIKRLPIAKQGKLLGIVSLSDLSKLALSDLRQIESSLKLASSFVGAVEIQSRTDRRIQAEIEPSNRAMGETPMASRNTSSLGMDQQGEAA